MTGQVPMITINDADFFRLVQFVRERFGINLEHKRTLIDARLSFDISRRGYYDFSRYVRDVISNPDGEECRHMINKLSTNYTYFFREPEYIEQLNRIISGDAERFENRTLNVWCAACSSGQEAYSLAMALELMRRLGNVGFDFTVTATDINTDILLSAERGIYAAEEAKYIPQRYMQYLFHRPDGTVEVCNEIKSKIKWEYHNLLDTAPSANTYDIIFCRNVMIYFTPELRKTMTLKLFSALNLGGYLFTGATESIDLERRYFHYLAPAFYQKTHH